MVNISVHDYKNYSYIIKVKTGINVNWNWNLNFIFSRTDADFFLFPNQTETGKIIKVQVSGSNGKNSKISYSRLATLLTFATFKNSLQIEYVGDFVSQVLWNVRLF